MTAGAGRLLAIAAIVLFLFAGIGVVQQGYWESSTDSQARIDFNDSVAITEGTTQTIASSNKSGAVYAPQTDINVTQNETVIDQNGNWTWNRPDGTINIADNSSFNTSQSAFVSGYYTVPSAGQNLTKTVGTLPTSGFGSSWMLIAGVLLVLLTLGILANTQ